MLDAVIITTIVFVVIIFITVYVVTAVMYMKLFAKANVAAWKAWIPVVNYWKFLQLGGCPGAISLLGFAGWLLMMSYLVFSFNYMLENSTDLFIYGQYNPFLIGTAVYPLVLYTVGSLANTAAAVFGCISAYHISRKLGKEGVWVVLYIFLSPVWLGIMAFNKSVWNDSLAKPAKGSERPPSWEPAPVSQYPAPNSQYPAPHQAYYQQPAPDQAYYQQPAPGQAYYQQPVPAPAQTNGLAIASLVCGILGLFFFLPAIPAIITGAMGLKKPGGKGLAITGLVLGIFGTLIWLISLVLIVMLVVIAAAYSMG